jgi:predicted alpha/beta-hydrolase family hydrolase
MTDETGVYDDRELTIDVEDEGPVSAILRTPESPRALLALAHGAGAGMRHRFMEDVTAALADRGIATLRYQFPYMEEGRKRPDRPPRAQATVRAAVRTARAQAPELPLLAGGKSFGGRMTSQAAASEPLEGVAGLVFLGFPLHPPGKPGVTRAEHLADVDVPMLFVQGTRDALADLELLRPVLDHLGSRARLHVVDGGDHSFAVLKRSGRTADEVLAEIAEAVVAFVDG